MKEVLGLPCLQVSNFGHAIGVLMRSQAPAHVVLVTHFNSFAASAHIPSDSIAANNSEVESHETQRFAGTI
jgi:hypothetical protein